MKILVVGINGWYIYHFWRYLLLALSKQGYIITVLIQSDEYFDRLQNLGFEINEVNFYDKSINPIKNIISFYNIFKIYKKISPDIVHHFNPKPVIFGTVAARILKIKKIINNYPGLGNLFREDKFKYKILLHFILILYRIINSSNKVISIFQVKNDISTFKKRSILGKSLPVLIQSSGVDLRRFKFREKFNVNNDLRVGMIARLNNDKGLDTFFEIAKSFDGESIKFKLVGQIDTKEKNDFTSFSNLCSKNNIKYLGFIENIENILTEIDVLILPTRRHEGIPRILIEAGACGISLIATDLGGCKDVIEHSVNGYIVNHKNSKNEAINHIKELNLNRNLLKEFGLSSRNFIKKKFELKSVINKYSEIYYKL